MIIDLCCGIGRFESPNEDVISIDLNKKFDPTICASIEYLPLRPNLKPRLCHASPPCKYFSKARLCRGNGYDEKGLAHSLRLVAACFDAFAYLQPKVWTLENPSGGVLDKILPTPNAQVIYTAYDLPNKKASFWSNSRSIKRSLIPQDIRQKILKLAE